MDESKLTAAITALLTVGIMFLNLGADLIKNGDYTTGAPLIIMGSALILTGAFLITTLTKTVAQNHYLKLEKKCCEPKTVECC